MRKFCAIQRKENNFFTNCHCRYIIERMNAGSKRIGLLINDTNSDYVKEIIDGIFSYCEEKNSSLFIFGVGELDLSYRPFDYHQKYLAQLCNKHNIDGVIACASVLGNHSDPEKLEKYIKGFSEVPIVSVGARIPGLPCVLSDARPGLIEVLDDFIVNHGRRKFCVVGKIPGSSEAAERTNIIADYLPLKGRRFDDGCIIDGNFTYETAMKGLDDYWEEKGRFEFDAVIALNDDMAFAAMDFCAKRKLQVPQQVCVAGFDDVPRAELGHPSLTTVNLNVFGQGRKAAESLFNIFEKKRVSDITSVSSAARFRSSCSCMEAQELGGGAFVKDAKAGTMSRLAGRSVSTEWLDKKRQFYIVNDFLASEQTRLNLAKFRKAFKGAMTYIGDSAEPNRGKRIVELDVLKVHDNRLFIGGIGSSLRCFVMRMQIHDIGEGRADPCDITTGAQNSLELLPERQGIGFAFVRNHHQRVRHADGKRISVKMLHEPLNDRLGAFGKRPWLHGDHAHRIAVIPAQYR